MTRAVGLVLIVVVACAVVVAAWTMKLWEILNAAFAKE